MQYISNLIYYTFSFASFSAVSIGGLIYFNQRKLIYPSDQPEGSRLFVASPNEYGMPDYQELFLESPDGLKLHGYFIRQSENWQNAPTIFYCHANAGNMGHRLPIAKILYQKFKANIMIFSYRGYGKSQGEAEEQGMKKDALQFFDYLLNHIPIDQNKIILFGQSIGGAVAIYVAHRNPDKIRALIVENTFYSIPMLIPKLMPYLTYFTFLCTEKWESYKLVNDLNLPLLFLSSQKDELVPKEQQRLLFDLFGSKDKKLVELPNATHNDAPSFELYWKELTNFWNQKILMESKL